MAQSFKSILKIAFENTCMSARAHSPQEAYNYAERMERMCLNSLNQELQGVCQMIESSNLKQAIEKLNSIAQE